MKVTKATQKVLADIYAERIRQQDKFGDLQLDEHHFDLHRNAVLGEEFGEVNEVLNEQYLDNVSPGQFDDDHLYKELVQVAAVAASWAEGLIRLDRV